MQLLVLYIQYSLNNFNSLKVYFPFNFIKTTRKSLLVLEKCRSTIFPTLNKTNSEHRGES